MNRRSFIIFHVYLRCHPQKLHFSWLFSISRQIFQATPTVPIQRFLLFLPFFCSSLRRASRGSFNNAATKIGLTPTSGQPFSPFIVSRNRGIEDKVSSISWILFEIIKRPCTSNIFPRCQVCFHLTLTTAYRKALRSLDRRKTMTWFHVSSSIPFSNKRSSGAACRLCLIHDRIHAPHLHETLQPF